MRRLLLVALVACGSPPRPTPVAPPAEGIAIAVYASASSAVIDDRRWIEVAGGSVVLDRIDPAAALQSLVIEPLGAEPLRVTACVRERVDTSAAGLASLAAARAPRPKRVIVMTDEGAPEPFRFEESDELEPGVRPRPSVLSPLVRCRVTARAGRHFVRVMHASSLAVRTRHELTMTTADRAVLATRFAIAMPAWRARADVVVYQGVPGGRVELVELARGRVILDGSTAILEGPRREVPARLRAIYDGALVVGHQANDIVWGRDSRRQVWIWAELDTTYALPAGPVHAHVALPERAPRDVDIAPELAQQTPETIRWPLWIDEDLLGTRRRVVERADGRQLLERLQLSVTNLGSEPREVLVEEPLRPTAKRRTVSGAWPRSPTFVKDRARAKLVLAPGATERFGFTIDYAF